MVTPRLKGPAVVVFFLVVVVATIAVMYFIRAENKAERERAARATLPPLEVQLDVACLLDDAAVTIVREAECNAGGVLGMKRVKSDPEVKALVWALVTEKGVQVGELPRDGLDVERNLPTSGTAYLYVFALGRKPEEKVDPRDMLTPLPKEASVKNKAAAIHGWAATLERRGIHTRVEAREIRIR